MRVLVLEATRLLAGPLEQAGCEVAVACSCAEAVTLAACSDLRRCCGRTPILLIVERDAPERRVEGLEAGADDCVSAPLALPELMARLRALVRRTQLPRPLGDTPAAT